MRFFVKSLLGYTTSRQVKKIVPLEFDFTGGSEVFTNSKSGVARLVGTGLFSGGGCNRAVRVEMLEVIAK
jgi:hypothetical protein